MKALETRPNQEEYLINLIANLEVHYSKLSEKYLGLHQQYSNKVDRLDETFAYIHAVKYAKDQDLDLNTVLAQQSQAQAVILDFYQIRPVLSACLQLPLYNLFMPAVMTPLTISHGVIHGILDTMQAHRQLVKSCKPLPYAELADKLYNKIAEHTQGFATALPLPEVRPLTAEEIATTPKEPELPTGVYLPVGEVLPFDQTMNLACILNDILTDAKEKASSGLVGAEKKEVEAEEVKIVAEELAEKSTEKSAKTAAKKAVKAWEDAKKTVNKLKKIIELPAVPADAITASTEVLSVSQDELKLLTPVTCQTLKDAAYLMIGRASTPYLLNGNLILHDEVANTHYRVVPSIDGDGYAYYSFRVFNHSNLSSRIYRQQNLLKTSPVYKERYSNPYGDTPASLETLTYEDLGHIKYAPLPKGDPQARREAIENLEKWDKTLTDRVNDIFYYSDKDDTVQAEMRQIQSISYFYPQVLFIGGHRLAAYTYYPVEYSTFITGKPTDPDTGKPLIYHVHHKDLCRSNNTPENLAIISDELNYALRSTSKPVIYQGTRYNTTKSYCEATNAGLPKELGRLTSNLKPDETVAYNHRLYTIDPDTLDILATDGEQPPKIIYGDTTYQDIKAFAKAHKLKPDTIQKGVYRAKKAGKSMYKHYKYKFYLDPSGNITIKTD